MAPPPPSPNPLARLTDSPLGPVLDAVHVDFVPADPQPSWGRWVLATVVALAGSLAADAALATIGKRIFPSTVHFVHFQFADYAKLTVLGVVVACIGWPVVTRISSRPRGVFLRLAVLVTLVLLLPDVWIWVRGEPARGVVVLVAMHLAIAVVTYNALVRIAPAGEARRDADRAGPVRGGPTASDPQGHA
jgi:hypothetical protein